MALGITASGEGYASVSTPVSAGGGVGATNFNLGNLGIGTSGSFGAASSIPAWIWYAAAAVALYYVVRKVRK